MRQTLLLLFENFWDIHIPVRATSPKTLQISRSNFLGDASTNNFKTRSLECCPLDPFLRHTLQQPIDGWKEETERFVYLYQSTLTTLSGGWTGSRLQGREAEPPSDVSANSVARSAPEQLTNRISTSARLPFDIFMETRRLHFPAFTTTTTKTCRSMMLCPSSLDHVTSSRTTQSRPETNKKVQKWRTSGISIVCWESAFVINSE